MAGIFKGMLEGVAHLVHRPSGYSYILQLYYNATKVHVQERFLLLCKIEELQCGKTAEFSVFFMASLVSNRQIWYNDSKS